MAIAPGTKGAPAPQVYIARPKVAFRLKGETAFRSLPGGSLPPYAEWHKIEQWFHQPAPAELDQKIKWRIIWCGGYEVNPVNQRRGFHHFSGKSCHCPPGPAIRALCVDASEIALAGGRGGGKSEITFAFLAKGDPTLPDDDPVRNSYLLSSDYVFLVLRKNAKDLITNFERAKRFFAVFGGTPSENTIRFPSGAYGIWDHVADGDAPDKYQGGEFTRIAWEEATQEKDEENYLKILMSNRSGNPRLKPQCILTANPGGKGSRWFTARFVRVQKEDGTFYQPGEYIKYDAGEGEIRTRVFIPSTVDDNPYLLRKGYDRQLELLRERRPALYRRWRLGDFTAVENAAFEEFRATVHPGEPPEALHVLPSTREQPSPIPLRPEWPRAMGLDYGYAHASGVTWGCWVPDGRIHIYREFVKPQVDTVSLGAEIALRSLEDLEGLPDHHMNVHLSPDAFNKTDSRHTRAHQIAQGIGNILGPNSVFLDSLSEDEEHMDAAEAWESVEKRRRERMQHTYITLRPARNKRIDGFALLHDYLRWWRILPEHAFDEDFARDLLLSKGVLAWAEYKQRIETQQAEVVPKMQVWSCCQNVIGFLANAVEKETDHEDVEKENGNPYDDAGDACLSEKTLVSTILGDVQISSIRPGDMVLTRAGYKPVLDAGLTRTDAPVYTVRFSDGRQIEATGNHSVFANDKWTPVIELRPGDTLCASSQLSSTALHTGATRTRNGFTSEAITGRAARTGLPGMDRCTGTSGNTTTAQSRMAGTFITRMRTRLTTIRKILRQCLTPITFGFTIQSATAQTSIALTSNGYALWPLPGIQVKPDWHGTGNTQKTPLPGAPFSSAHAITAEKHICTKTEGQAGSVRLIANRLRAMLRNSTSRAETALSAVPNSAAIGTTTPKHAPVRVLSVSYSGRATVYNLTVADQPEYFANGILVHNCRYLLMGFPFRSAALSKDQWVADKLRKLRESNADAVTMSGIVRAAQIFEYEFDQRSSNMRGYSIPRRAGPSAWRNNGTPRRVM